MKFPQRIELSPDTAIPNSMEPRLPTFEEVTGVVQGTPRLPSYSEGLRMRYHPYRRSMNTRDAIDRLMYTIYDDEYIKLQDIPPALLPRPVAPLVPGPLVIRPREDAMQMQRRARLDIMILNEFVAGLRRARHESDFRGSPSCAAPPRCARPQ